MIFLVPPFISWFIRTHLKYFIQSSFCITLKYFPHCKRKRKQNWWMVCNKVENQINRQLPQKLGFYSATAAAAAKSLQSCLTLSDPIDSSPPGSALPGILQARTLEWVAISFSNARKWKVKVKSLSHVWLLATAWTAAHQAPLSIGFSRQEYWSGVPLPSPWKKPTKCQLVWNIQVTLLRKIEINQYTHKWTTRKEWLLKEK